MHNNGWRYYNKAIVPTTAPHETANINELDDKNIWTSWLPNNPLFARWTSDFDCGYETNWWYIICDSEFSLEKLSKSSRKNIRKSLQFCEVRIINPLDNIDSLYEVYLNAIKKYKEYDNVMSLEVFKQNCIDSINNNEEYWGGYEKSTSKLIGYMSCVVKKDFMEMKVSKYAVDYLKLRVSDALNYVVLDHYLNERKVKYVLNGARSINHVTNVQQYYIERFNFRKAYCRLHIKYRGKLKYIIKCLYPFRNLIPSFIPRAHQIKAVLKMEEIVRS